MKSKSNEIIKQAGFNTKKVKLSNMVYKNPLSGKSTSQPLFMFNNAGEIFCIGNKPYCPIGGKLAFASLIQSGLNHIGYSFKEFIIETY